MQIKDRQKFLLIAAGAVLLLLVANSVVIEPLTASWKSRQEQIATLNSQVTKGATLLSHGTYYLSKWSDMKSNALPADVSLAEARLQRAFERWERDSGVTRVAYKPQWKEDEDDYTTLECQVEYTGNLERILSLLFNLEQDPIGLKVQHMEITTRDDNGQQLALNLQVSGLRLNPPGTTPAP